MDLQGFYKGLWTEQEQAKENIQSFFNSFVINSIENEQDNFSRKAEHNKGYKQNILIIDNKHLQDFRFNKPIQAIGFLTITEKKLLNRIKKFMQKAE